MIELDDGTAEPLVIETRLTERELLVSPVADLVARGLHRDLVTPLRRRWVGSSKAISPRFYRAIGMAAVATAEELNNVLGGHESLFEERLRMSKITAAPAGSVPRSQYRLAERVFTASAELGLEENAHLHGIRVQEAALYRRHFARLLADMQVSGAAPEDAPGFWYDGYALRPEILRKQWTPSPAGIWTLLDRSRV